MGAIDSDKHKFNRVISCNGAGGSSVEVMRSKYVPASERKPQHAFTAANRLYGPFTPAIYYAIVIAFKFNNGMCTNFCDCDLRFLLPHRKYRHRNRVINHRSE